MPDIEGVVYAFSCFHGGLKGMVMSSGHNEVNIPVVNENDGTEVPTEEVATDTDVDKVSGQCVVESVNVANVANSEEKEGDGTGENNNVWQRQVSGARSVASCATACHTVC